MPFLRDEGPPVSKDTIQRARESLPLEYGFQLVNETGREVLVVRVPKAKPDYLHDLADVAFYVTLDTIRNVRDVLLIGHEKTARLEPQLLRDNIRAQDREDAEIVTDLRRRLGREYGSTILQSPSNHAHQALAVRIPKGTVQEFSPDDVKAIRAFVEAQKSRFEGCQFAYIVADRDHERLGRRILLELLGANTAPAPAPAYAPAAPTAAPPLAQRVALPPTPGAPSPAPAYAPAGATATRVPPTVAAPPPTAPPAPVPAPAYAPAATTPPPPTPAAPEPPGSVETDEYAIITKPKPAAAPPPSPAPTAPAPAATPQPGAEVKVEAEYEIVTKPRPPDPVAPPAQAPAPPEPERTVTTATEEFEVYTSKPKPRETTAPGITPPGQGGFQAALAHATTLSGPAPTRTKEYEIMGRPGPVVDHPLVAPALAARPATAPPQPTADNGAPIVARVVPAQTPEQMLMQRFREAGYEIVEGLRAQGTIFAFAAHRPNGRRVLMKRATDFGPDDAATLAQLLAALGADVGLVVADRLAPGTRLATWGTRIEVITPGDVAAWTF